MKCALSLCTILAMIMFIIPTQIGCCSHNTNDMITLMGRDPNFRNDPCYIQWEGDQNAKLKRLFAERDKLERSMAENNRIREENRRREQEIRHKSYLSTSKVERKKESSFWKVLGVIVGVIVGGHLETDGPDAASPVSMVANNAGGNQTTIVSETEVPRLPSSSLQTDTSVPLLSRGVIRQDSLPTYDDAIKMPSAPPKE